VAAAVAAAAHVLVVGGGPVGVEAAAEVAAAYAPALRAAHKRVTLVGGRARALLGGGPLAAPALAALRALGVDVRLGVAARGLDLAAEAAAAARGGAAGGPRAAPRAVELVDAAGAPAGRVEGVDVVLPCVGGVPSTAWAAAGLPGGALEPRGGCVAVNAAFEVAGAEGRAVFALGDAAAHPAGEPALAHTAEKHGAAVAASVLAVLLRRGAPAAYPASSLAGAAPGAAPVIFAVSLGPAAALLDFNGRVVLSSAGAVQAAVGLLKAVLEATQVSQMRGGWAGRAFWAAADPIAMLVGRVLPRRGALRE